MDVIGIDSYGITDTSLEEVHSCVILMLCDNYECVTRHWWRGTEGRREKGGEDRKKKKENKKRDLSPCFTFAHRSINHTETKLTECIKY